MRGISRLNKKQETYFLTQRKYCYGRKSMWLHLHFKRCCVKRGISAIWKWYEKRGDARRDKLVKMKDKIIYFLNLIWTSIIAFSFPICFELIFLDITGHSKGYSYDLGSEKDISTLLGCIELVIWSILALPSIFMFFVKQK